MRTHYWHGWGYILVGAVVIANVINLAADVGAMGAALKLLIGQLARLIGSSHGYRSHQL